MVDILAWKNAGYYRLDFFLLRRFGPRPAAVTAAQSPLITGSLTGRLATQAGPSDWRNR